MKYLSILFFFAVQLCHSQDLSLQQLTKTEIAKKIQYHYQFESTDGHAAKIDLFLYKNQTFEYFIASNVYNAYTTGRWKSDNNIVTLNSQFQKGTLPVKVSYRQRDSSDFSVKQLSLVKNLNKKTLPYAFVYINNDSTRCMDGDLLCTGEYKQIERVKVVLENNGPSSKWINIPSHKGLIQLTVLTKRDLENYIILTNKKYTIDSKKLKPLDNK